MLRRQTASSSLPQKFGSPASCLISYLIVGEYSWFNAIALLIVPFTFSCWVFTTVRALHMVGARFSFIPSTYVNSIGGIIALVLCAIMLVVSQESARQGRDVGDATSYVAAAILYGSCLAWSYFYNWRRTNSAILAVSLTIRNNPTKSLPADRIRRPVLELHFCHQSP
jgi:hypothetical protein